jgi:hypothetical protein
VIFRPQMESPAAAQIVYTLSSLQTFYMKFVFPIVWIGLFTAGTVTLLAASNLDPDAAFLKWLFPAVTVVGAVFLWWACMRLKRVRMDDHALYISNYVSEIVVPLRDVAEVTENRWINIHPVTIKFRRETDFGSQIVFMPKVRWFAFFSSHPVVADIRNAVARAVGNG